MALFIITYLTVTILHNWINYYMDTEVDREDDDEFNPELLKATCY